MRILAVVLAFAMNLGIVDGVVNSFLRGMYTSGLTNSLVQVNSVPAAFADPGEGSFSPSVFDPNHDETSKLIFKFDYDHDVKIELYRGRQCIKTLSDRESFEGRLDNPEDETPEKVTNSYEWNGKDGSPPIDDGVYTIVLTPLDEWAEYPLEADVTVRNIPHTPVIKGISINQKNGLINISGTSQPDNVIHLFDYGKYIFSVTADSKGEWWAYNKPFTKAEKHLIQAKAENRIRRWPTQSSLSTGKLFLTYQIKGGDCLSLIANYYLRNSREETVNKIKNDTGIKGKEFHNNTIYAGNWLLIMDPVRWGDFNPPGKLEPVKTTKENGVPKQGMGDPINSVTGNYSTTITDLFISGRGLSFDFTRTYNTQSDFRGQLGFRWDFSLNRSLIFYENGIVGHQKGDGGIDTFQPDGQGKFTAPKGVYDTLEQNDSGSFNLRRKDGTIFNFDGSGRLVKIKDRNENTISINYNDEGQIDNVTDTAGRQINFVYDDELRIKEITDTQNRRVKYDYDEKGDLVTVTDSNVGITKYEYDDQHFMLKSIDPKGYIIVENTYDEQGRVLTQKDAKGNISYFSYDELNRNTTFTDNKGTVTIFEYNEDLLPTVITRKANNTRETINYDENGNKKSVTDFKGNITYFGYDSVGNLTSIKDHTGKNTFFDYDSNNNLTSILDAKGYVTFYNYDSKGNLTAITDPAGKTQTYQYNEFGQPVKIVDRYGAETIIEYDTEGNILQVTDPRGGKTKYGYDKIGRVVSVTDPRDNSSKIGYDNRGQVTQTISPLNQVRNFKYDLNGNLAEVIDSKGNTTHFEYDAMDNLIKITDPMGNVSSMEYDKNNNRTKIHQPLSGTVEYKYDDLDRVTEIKDPMGAVTKLEYDAVGNVVSLTDPKGAITKYEYDKTNQVTAVINALNLKTNFAYDELGNLVRTKDPRGAQTSYQYDRLSRLIKITNALGQESVISYDDTSREKTVTDTGGNSYKYLYDEADNLVQVTDPLGNKTTMKYDGNNNLIELTNSLNQVKKFQFDKANRLVGVIDPQENLTKIEYDLNDNRTKVTDPENHTTECRYDKLDRLVKVIDALGQAAEYKYDAHGNLLELIDANRNVTRNEYDLKGRLLQTTDPIGKQKKFIYDLKDNITEKIDGNGISTLYEYDALNRLTGVQYPGEYLKYSYDEQGNRTVTEDVYGATTYQYNLLGHMTAVTDPDGYTLSYEYNKTGQRSKMTYPDGKEVKYFYDKLNRLNNIIDWSGESTEYGYDAVGRRTMTVLPNGVRTDYAYDMAGNLTSLVNAAKSGEILSRFDYGYDRAGSRINLTETMGDETRTLNYQYDPLYQLKKAVSTDGTETDYIYDAAGNRTEMARKEGETITRTKYTYNDANELTSLMADGDEGPTMFDYDGNGSLVNTRYPDARFTDYFYDPANRLIEVDSPEDKVVIYDYDADGNRIMKLTTKSPVKDIVNDKEPKPARDKSNQGKPDKDNRAKKQSEDNLFSILKKGGNGGGNSGGGSSGGNGGGKSGGNSGGGNSGGGKGNSGSGDRDKGQDKSNNGKGFKEKGKHTNRGKHLGWYKNGKYAELLQLGLNPQLVETTYYVNDIANPASQVLMTLDEQDNYTAAYSYGLERIKVEAVDETRPDSQIPLYYLHDGLGSTRQLVRANGAVRDHYNYDEFGDTVGAKLSEDGRNVNHNTFGYTGELWDEEDDLLYLRSRYYAPDMGRFMTRDTFPGYAVNPLSIHKYAYVENNPVNFVDPLGFNKKDSNNDIYGPPNPDDSVFVAGPDAIQKAGYSYARQLIESVMDEYNRYGIPEPYSIRDYSYGQLYSDIYYQEKEIAKNTGEWLSTGDLLLSLGKAKGQTGTWFTDVGLGVFDWMFSPEPNLSDTVDLTSKKVAKAKTIMNYVNDSQYKYLIYNSSVRKEFIQNLNSLADNVTNQLPSPYKNSSDNLKYQQAAIGYIRGIILMNSEFKKSKNDLVYLISQIN